MILFVEHRGIYLTRIFNSPFFKWMINVNKQKVKLITLSKNRKQSRMAVCLILNIYKYNVEKLNFIWYDSLDVGVIDDK
jgi:hypothetical protein